MCVVAATIPADISGVRPGVMKVAATAESLTVSWPDEASRTWFAEFSLESTKPLITRIGLEGRSVVRNASPQYWAATGKRRGPAGFDEFFDNPGSHPEGTRRFEGVFRPVSVKAISVGDRVEVLFQGLKLGIFDGGIAYTFYPGSRLVQQEAVVSTQVPDTAYLYDTGLRLARSGWRCQTGSAGGGCSHHLLRYRWTATNRHDQRTRPATGLRSLPSHRRCTRWRQPGGISAASHLYRPTGLHDKHGLCLVPRLGWPCQSGRPGCSGSRHTPSH